MKDLLTYGMYYYVTVVMLYALVVLYTTAKDATFKKLPELAWGFLVGSLTTAVVFWHVPPDYRLYPDEVSLIGTSKLFYTGKIFRTLAADIPFRQPLYPYVVSLVHEIFGYKPVHAFVISAMSLAGVLGILFVITRYWFDRTLALCVVILFSSFPVVQQTFSSAQYDGLNLLLVMAFFFQTIRFFEKPNGLRFEPLLVIGLLAGLCRYESILLVGVAVLAGYLTGLSPRNLPWRIWFIPTLIVPILIHRDFIGPEFLRTSPNHGALFSLSYVPENLYGLAGALLKRGAFQKPTAPEVVWLAIAGFGLAINLFVRNRLWRFERRTLIAAFYFLYLGFIGSIHFTYFEGDFRPGFKARYLLPYLVVISISAAFLLNEISKRARVETLSTIIAFAILVRYFIVAEVNHNYLNRRRQAINHFLSTEASLPYAIVDAGPETYWIDKIPAYSFSELKNSSRGIERFQNVYVFENESRHKIQKTPELKGIERKLVRRIPVGEGFLRISKLPPVRRNLATSPEGPMCKRNS